MMTVNMKIYITYTITLYNFIEYSLVILVMLWTTAVGGNIDHKDTHFVTAFLNLKSDISSYSPNTVNPEILLIPQVLQAVNISIHYYAPADSNLSELYSLSGESTENEAAGEPVIKVIDLQLSPGTSHLVTIPSGVRMTPGEVDRKGIKITSTVEIAIYSINKSPHSNDAILVLPTDALGDDYVIPSYSPGTDYITSFGIIGAWNNTLITITLPPDKTSLQVSFENKTYGNADIFTIQLKEYETVQLKSLQGDLSGVVITSANNKTFAVIIGSSRRTAMESGSDFNRSYTGSGNNYSEGHSEEQVIPSRAWGTAFIALPFGLSSSPDMFQITASCDNTSVSVKTTDVQTTYYLRKGGESVQVNLNNTTDYDFICITADRPVSVLQYYCSVVTWGEGNSINDNIGSNSVNNTDCDSYLITIPPLQQQEKGYVYSTISDSYNQSHAITLVINSSQSNGLLIDDLPPEHYVKHNNNSGFLSISIDGYDSNFTAMKLYIPSTGGYHNITHVDSSTPFSAISHSSPIGMSMADLSMLNNYDNTNNEAELPPYNIEPLSEIVGVDNIQLMETTSENDGSGTLPGNVIAVIVTLTSAIFFVIVCILGFVLTETVCRRDGSKVAPYVS